ncbi:MAG TPA: hypothetical protein VLB50_12700, partial [Ignavibacteriaceae bacterium]|nr:hypothetical protein [Ignavibacteriaceae bacterium]
MKIFDKILILIAACQIIILPQEITDLIKPLNLKAGISDTILISDLYYAPDYQINLLPNKNIRIDYDKNKEILIVKPDNKFEGFGLIDFKVNNSVYSIPYFSRIIENHKFELNSGEHPANVNLFGSFNGWNRENLTMKYDKKTRTYSVSVPLSPGNYQYKYKIQDKEILDPDNADSIPNGLGGFNSVVNILNPHPEKCYLFIDNYENSKGQVTISFIYSNSKYKSPVKRDEIIGLLNNKSIPPVRISTAANKFLVTIDSTDLKGENVLRVAVNRNGQPSNIQTVMFYDG